MVEASVKILRNRIAVQNETSYCTLIGKVFARMIFARTKIFELFKFLADKLDKFSRMIDFRKYCKMDFREKAVFKKKKKIQYLVQAFFLAFDLLINEGKLSLSNH